MDESTPVRTPGEMGLADVRIIEAIHDFIRQDGRVVHLSA
jgi:hypothetical protein